MDAGQVWLVLGAVLLSSALSAIGSGVAAAISVGGRVAKEHAAAIADLSLKVAALEIRVMNGVTETLKEIKLDVKALVIEASNRPCQTHTEALNRAVERLAKLEEAK